METQPLTHWFLARLKYSSKMEQPFYSTSLRNYEDANADGQTRVLAPKVQQSDDAPQCQIYFGQGIASFQSAEPFAYVNTDEAYTGNLIMTSKQMKATIAKIQKANAEKTDADATADAK